MLSSGQEFDEKFLDSKHVLKVYFKPSRKNKIFVFLPDPILPVWLRILHLKLSSKFFFLPQAANTTEYQGYTKYLEDVIKVPIKDLVHSQKSKVITELLLQLHSYPKRVMTGFSFIIKNDERSKWEGSKISKPELAKYIQPQFLGVLNFFDTNLKNETGLVTLEEKVDILSSLTEIIKLMGSEFVASVKHKILSTLNSGKLGHLISNSKI